MNGAADLPLRDIHLPDPIGWWPLAPVWWLLLALLLLIVLAAWAWSRQRRRTRVRRAALAELAGLEANWRRNRDPHALAAGISALLRRSALSVFPRREVAGLSGQEWLAFLDRLTDGRVSRNEAGRSLLEAPYRPATTIDGDALIALCGDCLRALPLIGERA